MNGFCINGVSPFLGQSYRIDSAGDINADGIEDLIIGIFHGLDYTSYVVFGTRSRWPSIFELSSLNGNNGFTIKIIKSGGFQNNYVTKAGDINGDGIEDLIIGSLSAADVIIRENGYFDDPGTSYVLFGKQGRWPVIFDLSSLNGTNGFIINGISGSGSSVARAGDLNQDGVDDLIIGTKPKNNCNFDRLVYGKSYVVFGKQGKWPASFELSNLNGINGFKISSINYASNSAVASAGDINGDGVEDVIITEVATRNAYSTSYVVFGRSASWPASFELSTLNGANGFSINCLPGGEENLISASKAGDINGDGIDDVIIGAPKTCSYSGMSYVVFGKRGRWSASFDVSSLNGINGFSIDNGCDNFGSKDEIGTTVTGIGDFNEDGVGDLMIGTIDYRPETQQYRSYVVFGKQGKWSESFKLSSLNGTNGFGIDGPVAGQVASGDITGDGVRDLMIGMTKGWYESDANFNPCGNSTGYVLFGGASLLAPSLTPSTSTVPSMAIAPTSLQNRSYSSATQSTPSLAAAGICLLAHYYCHRKRTSAAYYPNKEQAKNSIEVAPKRLR